MPRIRDHQLLDVNRGGPHHHRHGRAEGFLAADGEDRHAQLAVGDERLVVDRVLIKGGELVEAGVHRAGLRIEPGVVFAGLLAEPARVGRELVPEPIEVDSLPSGHEPFSVRTLEGEMPEGTAANDLIPWPDARQRRIQENEAGDSALDIAPQNAIVQLNMRSDRIVLKLLRSNTSVERLYDLARDCAA